MPLPHPPKARGAGDRRSRVRRRVVAGDAGRGSHHAEQPARRALMEHGWADWLLMSICSARCVSKKRRTVHAAALRLVPKMLYLPLMLFKP